MFSSNNGILWRAEKTSSGWAKRGWSAEWLCIIVVSMVMPRTPVPPSGLNSNADSVHKLVTVASFSILIATWDCFPKKDLYPASLTLPPVLYIKKPDVPGFCVVLLLLHQNEHSPPGPALSTRVSVCLSFLHGLSHAGFGGLELFVSCLHSEFWTLVHIIYTSESPVTIQTGETVTIQ